MAHTLTVVEPIWHILQNISKTLMYIQYMCKYNLYMHINIHVHAHVVYTCTCKVCLYMVYSYQLKVSQMHVPFHIVVLLVLGVFVVQVETGLTSSKNQ